MNKTSPISQTYWAELKNTPRFSLPVLPMLKRHTTFLQRLGYEIIPPNDISDLCRRSNEYMEKYYCGKQRLRGQRDTWRMFWPGDHPADMTQRQAQEHIEFYNAVHHTEATKRVFQRRRTAINNLTWFGFAITAPTDSELAQRILEYASTDHRCKLPAMNAGGASDE
ncbi:MAG: hypothetical protein IJB81_06185 [Clostridia bacterium]|nr:hypothetical protein [Clostridia bacterium]